MSLEISRQTLEIPAWGRNFKLGTLYDCRTDKIVPGNKALLFRSISQKQ